MAVKPWNPTDSLKMYLFLTTELSSSYFSAISIMIGIDLDYFTCLCYLIIGKIIPGSVKDEEMFKTELCDYSEMILNSAK